MLYQESKAYLLGKLKEAGLKSKPYTTMKGLEKSQESHIGAVIFDQEAITRNGSKTQYKDQEGARHKRRKVFNRAITFTVTIGDYTDDAVETMFERFLASLDRGIYVNGDFVPIEVDGADWVNKDDSTRTRRSPSSLSSTTPRQKQSMRRWRRFGPSSESPGKPSRSLSPS